VLLAANAETFNTWDPTNNYSNVPLAQNPGAIIRKWERTRLLRQITQITQPYRRGIDPVTLK